VRNLCEVCERPIVEEDRKQVPRCQASNKDGSQCKFPATYTNEMCGKHFAQDLITPAEIFVDGQPTCADKRGRSRQYHKDCRRFSDSLRLVACYADKLILSDTAARRVAGEIMLVRNSVRKWIDHDGRKTFGEKVRESRQSKGWLQTDLAKAMGISARKVSAIELGQCATSRRVKRQILEHLIIIDTNPF